MLRTFTALLAIGLFGCGGGTVTPSSLVTDVQDVGDAASVAVVTAAALEATGAISAADAQLVENVGAGVAADCDKSITELQSADSSTVMVSKVVGYFEATGISTAGLSPQATALVVAISAAVQVLLNQLKSPTVAAAAAMAREASPTVALSRNDRKALSSVQVKARTTVVAANGWKPRHAK
jgi:hypothetical protein